MGARSRSKRYAVFVARGLPGLTVVVDTPARIQRWFSLLDEITPERGLITSEIVPAFRATGP